MDMSERGFSGLLPGKTNSPDSPVSNRLRTASAAADKRNSMLFASLHSIGRDCPHSGRKVDLVPGSVENFSCSSSRSRLGIPRPQPLAPFQRGGLPRTFRLRHTEARHGGGPFEPSSKGAACAGDALANEPGCRLVYARVWWPNPRLLRCVGAAWRQSPSLCQRGSTAFRTAGVSIV